MGPGQHSRLLIIHNWKAFFSVPTKTNSLLQIGLICIILYIAHRLYFFVQSQGQRSPPNPFSFSHMLFQAKERTLHLRAFLASRNYILVLRIAAASPSLLSFYSFLPQSSCIYKYFGIVPSFYQKQSLLAFFLPFSLLVFEAFQKKRSMNLCCHACTGHPEGFCRGVF